MLRGHLETETSCWGAALGVFWGNAFPPWKGLAGMVARGCSGQRGGHGRASVRACQHPPCRNAAPELQDPWEQHTGREGSSQRRVFTIVCRGTGTGIPHLPQVFGEPRMLSEEWRNAAQRNVNAVGWNPLSQQPFPAPAGSSSWLVQLGFPCALSLFQLPQLWQLIPLLPFTSPGHTPVPTCPHCPSDVTRQRGGGSVGAVGRGAQGTGALGRSQTAPGV